jgi:signal transduction histidine kinase
MTEPTRITDREPADRSGSSDAGSRNRRPGSATGGEPARRLATAAEEAASRWPLGRILGVGVAAIFILALAAIIVGATALANLSSRRDRLIDTIEPARFHVSQLYASLLNQETGLRGYLLSADKSFLAPYSMGMTDQRRQVALLRPLLAGAPADQARLAQVLNEVAAWRSSYVDVVMAKVASTGKPYVSATSIATGKMDFDKIRAPLAAMQASLTAQAHTDSAQLKQSATVLDDVGAGVAAALLLIVLGVAGGMLAAVIRPVAQLADEVRRVSSGDFDHEVARSGPREVQELAVDVNRMRERILRELSAVRVANARLENRAIELERSNAELEQFAYVASHDLQEPLRKVASFCQLLQRRYVGQLDQRADQYIEFAVDGAKRMQALIDDLLAFSRVGRTDRDPVLVSCASALSQARVNLAAQIRQANATIETTELPSVRAEFSLITSLFQNLVGNGIKFRSEKPPVVRIAARRDGKFWLFSVADNGIGIEPEFADRIFVIFQRLHDRAAYVGTGIGLAMCRKIVEYYGGRIWLDTTVSEGATFYFTLPAPLEEETD